MKQSLAMGLALLICAGAAEAQFPEPEVRRALPVTPTSPTPAPTPRREPPTPPAVPFPGQQFENPAWMDRARPSPARTSPTIRPSAPPAETGRAPTPSPREILSIPATAPTPLPAPVIPTTAPGADSGENEIRLAPALSQTVGPEATLDAANGFYSRKAYDLAIPEYEKYLVSTTSSAPGRPQALFRLAESHRFMGRDDAARAGYERLLAEVPSGEFVGAGAYRLAEVLYAERRLDAALGAYQKAFANSKDADVQLTARFYEARCLDGLKKPAEAEAIYREVAAKAENNPYRDYARLALAESAATAGRKKEALDQYLELSRTAGKPSIAVEATVKAAIVAADLGNPTQARELYRKALKMPESGDWKGVALIGSMRAAYALDDFTALGNISKQDLAAIPEDYRAEALLLVGNAQRQQGKFREAKESYDRILSDHPNAPAAADARFQRLVVLFSLDSKDTQREIDTFLLAATSSKERAQAMLLKAEVLFKAKNFAEAGKLYDGLQGAQLADGLKVEALYKLGWCQAQLQDYPGAIATYTKFVDANPSHPLVASAIVQRALARQTAKDEAGAMVDFDLLIEKYPKSKERELALQQKALILGQRKDNAAMTATFTTLLTDYPKSAAAAQANFWIGWAAFENKDYSTAISRLDAARKLDPKGYNERATLRILLAYYYTDDRNGASSELATFKRESAPAEILRWLGMKYFEDGQYAKAEEFLIPITKAGGAPATPEIYLSIAQAQIKQKKWKLARENVAKYLETARDPISRARGLLAHAETLAGEKRFDEAVVAVDEAMMLQPEGRYNAEARMLQAEMLSTRGDPGRAAQAFMTISLLYDDKDMTPRALIRANETFRQSGNAVEADKALRELKQRYPDYTAKSGG